jgi:hypothetical protein
MWGGHRGIWDGLNAATHLRQNYRATTLLAVSTVALFCPQCVAKFCRGEQIEEAKSDFWQKGHRAFPLGCDQQKITKTIDILI